MKTTGAAVSTTAAPAWLTRPPPRWGRERWSEALLAAARAGARVAARVAAVHPLAEQPAEEPFPLARLAAVGRAAVVRRRAARGGRAGRRGLARDPTRLLDADLNLLGHRDALLHLAGHHLRHGVGHLD